MAANVNRAQRLARRKRITGCQRCQPVGMIETYQSLFIFLEGNSPSSFNPKGHAFTWSILKGCQKLAGHCAA